MMLRHNYLKSIIPVQGKATKFKQWTLRDLTPPPSSLILPQRF